MEKVEQLIEGLKKKDIRSLARAISLVENDTEEGKLLLEQLDIPLNVPVIGITGPPGAGKSTLLNALIHEILKVNAQKSIAIIAVDPSSPFNMGALLGDRVRMSDHYLNERVFIRSLGSRGSLGGLSDKILEVTDICRTAGFDYIFIETVGVGQSEVEIAGLADITTVVLVPESGDEVQTMKAGLMEIADIFVVNKSDRDESGTFYHNLAKLVKHKHHEEDDTLQIIKTNANEKSGIKQLLNAIEKSASSHQHLNLNRKSHLMSLKAIALIKKCRTEDLNEKTLSEEISKHLSSGRFQLYRFVKGYC